MKDVEKLMSKLRRYIKQYNSSPYGREIDGTVELLEECVSNLARLKHYDDMCESGKLITIPVGLGDTFYRIGYKPCHNGETFPDSYNCTGCYDECDICFTIYDDTVRQILCYINGTNTSINKEGTYWFKSYDDAKAVLKHMKEQGKRVNEDILNE